MGKGNLRIVMSFLLCYESTVGKEILMVKNIVYMSLCLLVVHNLVCCDFFFNNKNFTGFSMLIYFLIK